MLFFLFSSHLRKGVWFRSDFSPVPEETNRFRKRKRLTKEEVFKVLRGSDAIRGPNGEDVTVQSTLRYKIRSGRHYKKYGEEFRATNGWAQEESTG
jgi:hypothetical protein